MFVLCFAEKKLDYINVSKHFKASWSVKKKGIWSLTSSEIVEMFSFLMNNIYVKFQGKVYRQVIGIPMGCDCAPKVADLFLYWYEHSYTAKSVLDGNVNVASKLKGCL